MDPCCLYRELQNSKEDIVIFKKLVNFASSRGQQLDNENLTQWQSLLEHIIGICIPNREITRERTLLASHAFFALLSIHPNSSILKNTFQYFLQLNSNQFHFLSKQFNIVDSELFKLICTYGYLQVNRKEMYSDDISLIIFDTIYKHWITYTGCSFFAYKVLCMWLQRTMNTNIWSTCDSTLEQKLEAVIFSNWCNAINEISKQNSSSIFNMYLRIMGKKYDGFLEYMFKHCVDNVSWQNETKYVILAEICEVWDNVKAVTSYDFLLSLCTSLTKHHLRSAGTKVYIVILKKLNEDAWKETFGSVMKFIFHHWEMEDANHSALQLLCKNWLEPAVKKYKNILPFLWDLTRNGNDHYLRLHLQKIASDVNIELPEEADINCCINHKDEVVRLYGFAISCHRINNSLRQEKGDEFSTIRYFLRHNANSTSVYMRDGITKYFKVLFANLLKICETMPRYKDDVRYMIHWLYEFLLDCFEIDSCYQRKILGLNLHRATLSFTDGTCFNKCNNMENATCTLLFQKHFKDTGIWKFTDKKNLFALLRLVLDSALDVRQLATRVILDYFDKNILTDSEKEVLFRVALENCNSSKFYKIESGAALVTILSTWFPLSNFQNVVGKFDTLQCKDVNNYSTYSNFLLEEATRQLTQMKDDILKAIVRNEPFYGVLTAFLNVVFRDGPENRSLTLEFVENVLFLLKDAVDFLLSVLLSKSANTEYSSSFAEMGLAIDEAIKNSKVDDVNYDELNLTPAHQVLVSSIWMSLKIACEIACETGALMYSKETVRSSIDIIVTVLFKCRHKGAVEAAGTAIGNLMRSLCNKKEYCELPKMYILNILKKDTVHSLNITRRSAGLSIMFHKVVVSDNRSDRPLLHFATQILLDLLDDFSDASLKNVDSQHDSPLARRLHYLRALVADKEIHAQLTPYMERISLICFRYLESEEWTIRNASLQLFGAIVPRLAGHSYGDGALDFGSGYAVNHFVTHYPILAAYVTKQLEQFSSTFTNFSVKIYLHSSIIHVLILLSKFSYSGCDLIDYSSQEYVQKSKHFLRSLLSDPVLYVRLLSAKAYAALTASSCIKSEIEQLKRDIFSSRSTNLIHGYLLTIKYLKERLSVETNYVCSLKDTRCTSTKECLELSRFRQISRAWNDTSKELKNAQPCYMLEMLILQLSETISEEIRITDILSFDENASMLSSQMVQPGFFLFVDQCAKLYADYVKRSESDNSDIVIKILNSPCTDLSVAMLSHLPYYVPILQIVTERLLNNVGTDNELLLNAMIDFALRTLKHMLKSGINVSHMVALIENMTMELNESLLNSKLSCFKCILIMIFSKNEIIVNDMLSYILEICVHEEEHVRLIAVDFLQFSVHRFEELRMLDQLIVIHCCLILLKDEIIEIRETIAECLRTYVLPRTNSNYNILQHDTVMYHKLLSEIFNEVQNLSVTDRNRHFMKLFTQSIKDQNHKATIENPFYHDDSPSYREESKFLNICYYYIERSNAIKRNKICSSEDNPGFISDEIQAKYLLETNANLHYTNLEAILSIRYVDYLLRKRGIIIQEYN